MEEIDTRTVNQNTVEIRIPTYKRPALLQRALNSVLQQSYSDWIAIVFDDSPEQEAKSIVQSYEDPRLIYQPNGTNLGGAGNIDQAFYTGSYMNKAGYATALEDDNWWYPDFLKFNVEALQTENVQILLRNQEVWEHKSGNDLFNTGRTTRGEWMQEGVISPFSLHSYLFFFEGVSNGGMFWETNCNSDLQVGETINDPGLQEYCRTLQIKEPILFKSEPFAIWTKMRRDDITRHISKNRVWGRGRQALLNYLTRCYGNSINRKAKALAKGTGRFDLFDHAMADILSLNWKCHSTGSVNCFKMKAKSLVRYLFVADPLKAYIQKKRPLE